MKKCIHVYVFLLFFITLACSKTATSQKGNPANKANDSNLSKIDNKKAENYLNQSLNKQIEEISAAAKGRVGVAAMVLETGNSIGFNSTDRFPMQSVYKFPIAMAILHQVDEGKLKLDQVVRVEKSDLVKKTMRSPIRDENPNGADLSLRELVRFAVSESDGTASDVLLRVVGGAAEVDKYLKSLEVYGVVVANPEKEIGSDWQTQYKNWATPDSAVKLLQAFHEHDGISESSHQLLTKFMTETPTGLKRLKGLLPENTVVVHKTGTSGSRNGVTAATNDIGLITLPNGQHLAIAVFVSDSPADEATRELVIAKIAKAVFDAASK